MFLVLFVANYLSALLLQVNQQKIINPVKVCARAPGISHHVFADDTIIFFKVEKLQAMHIKEVICRGYDTDNEYRGKNGAMYICMQGW